MTSTPASGGHRSGVGFPWSSPRISSCSKWTVGKPVGEDSALGSNGGFHSKLVCGYVFWSSRIGEWTIRVASNPALASNCYWKPSGSTMELSKLRRWEALEVV